MSVETAGIIGENRGNFKILHPGIFFPGVDRISVDRYAGGLGGYAPVPVERLPKGMEKVSLGGGQQLKRIDWPAFE